MVLIHADSFCAWSNIGASWLQTWEGLLEGRSGFVYPGSEYGLNDWPLGPPMGVIADWGPRGVPAFEERTVRLLNLLAEEIRPYVDQLSSRYPHARIFGLIASSHGDPGPVSSLISNGKTAVSRNLKERLLYDNLAIPVRQGLNRELPVSMVAAACASALVAAQLARQKLEAGNADIVVVFSADTASLIAYTGFDRTGAMSKTGTRPFDENHDGMTASEGGVAFVLSREDFFPGDHPPLAIVGAGCNCDRGHIVEPSVKGVLEALEDSLSDGGLSPPDISFIYWHGTGTRLNDAAESEAAKTFFGKNIPPGCSTKGNLGHTMGASGGFNLMGASYTLLTNTLPPTGRLETPFDPLFPVSNRREQVEGKLGLCMALGFGGINASLILKRL